MILISVRGVGVWLRKRLRGHHSTQNVKPNYGINLEKNYKLYYIIVMIEEPLTLKREGAKVKAEGHSSKMWKKRLAAIKKASGDGRCWWIAQYLRHTL